MKIQTILITGAASGIGKQSALGLAARGHNVIATARSLERLTDLKQSAEKADFTLTYEVLDITKPEQAQKLAEKYQIDVLYNNASSGQTGPIAEVPLDRVRSDFETNVVGTLGVIQAFTPQMIDRKSGRILIMSSMVGLATPMFFNPYAGTKAALESMANSLRNELKYFNIEVVILNPGRIDGGHNAEIAETKYEWLKQDSPYFQYKDEMKRHDNMLLNNAYPIEPVVKDIIKAVESPHPKVRYASPFKYRFALVLIRIFPTRVHDWAFFRSGRFGSFK